MIQMDPVPVKYESDTDEYDTDPAQMILDQCWIKGRNTLLIGSGQSDPVLEDPKMFYDKEVLNKRSKYTFY